MVESAGLVNQMRNHIKGSNPFDGPITKNKEQIVMTYTMSYQLRQGSAINIGHKTLYPVSPLYEHAGITIYAILDTVVNTHEYLTLILRDTPSNLLSNYVDPKLTEFLKDYTKNVILQLEQCSNAYIQGK